MKKYFYLFIVLLFAAINFNLFLKPLELVTGGTQGLALLLNSITKLKPSFLILVINIITLIISYFTLEKNTTYGTLAASFVYPLLVRLTNFIPSFSLLQNHILISSILAGIVCGITGGYIYKLGFSSGGISTINLCVNKYFHIKVALSNFLINTFIIICGCFLFGIRKGLYSIIVIIVSSYLINRLIRN